MYPLLSMSSVTFTQEKVERILREVPYKVANKIRNLGSLSDSDPQPQYELIPIPYTVWSTEHELDEGANLIGYNTVDRRKRAFNEVKTYCDALQDHSGHVDCLDASFTKLLEFNFKPPEGMDSVVKETCHLLERLPAVPPMLGIDTPSTSNIYAGFFVEGSPQFWENLRVVRFVDSNIIRLAMLIVIESRKERHIWNRKIVEYIDLIGELFGVASEQASSSQLPITELAILRQFLWTGWQRAVLLNFYYTLTSETTSVSPNHRERSLVLGVQLNASLREALQSKSVQSSSGTKAEYMCSWAFELLRTDRAAVAQDFRVFHERYNAVLGHLPPRCIVNRGSLMKNLGPKQCKGKYPTQCQRFRGMKITNQSAHALPCRGNCPRLYWDEYSYRNISGARAVSIVHTKEQHSLLWYCKASDTTMAISHVWSHGQGGRPEAEGTGFNTCLHHRYRRIARSLGCDSYWMDTPCIPQDHDLRHEAIMEINNIFTNSKVTLVCDRDIMSIDVSDLTVERQESILSALLVCDWNVRAWTYLESVKGRDNIFLLCKNDAVLRLGDILKTVYDKGNMSIAVLFLTAQHLLPRGLYSAPTGDTKAEGDHFWGGMEVEDAANNLSHRHASRPGDEVVIWSLLTLSVTVGSDALKFWKLRIGSHVPTGFLISSSPRIGYKSEENLGFGWAPCRPDLPERKRWWQRETFHFAFDGVDTEYARINEDGLSGQWVSRVFDAHPPWPHVIWDWGMQGTSAEFRMLRRVASMIPRRFYWGALLAPADYERSTSVDPVLYRGKADGTVLAVVASHGMEDGILMRYSMPEENQQPWYWIGVVEWPKSIPLPKFQREAFLIV